MAAERAAALLPEARLRVRDVQLEQAVWEELLQELHELSPFLESPGRGVAFLRAGALPALRERARSLGAHVGVAPARAWAHLAALRAAAGHLLHVEAARVEAFLAQYPTQLLERLGFSAELVERLLLFGYDVLQRVAGLSRRHLTAQFGEEGRRLHRLLHAEERHPVPLFRPPPVVEVGWDFDLPAGEPGELLPVLEHLVETAAERLGSYRCRRVRLRLRPHGAAGEWTACRVLPVSTAAPRRLWQTAATLLHELLAPECTFTSLVLELGALHAEGPRQGVLFHERPALVEAARVVHHKFPGALLRAVTRPDALFEEDRFAYEVFPLDPPPRPARGRTSRRRR